MSSQTVAIGAAITMQVSMERLTFETIRVTGAILRRRRPVVPSRPMERPDATTVRRFGALVGVLVGIAYVVLVWLGSNDLRNDLLVPRNSILETVEIATVGAGRIGLARTEATEQPGVWGVRTETGFGTTGQILEIRQGIVVRSFETLEGVFEIGQIAQWDPLVFRGDPEDAHRIDYEFIRIPGELGANPAWFIDGRQDTWVILIHGRDTTLEQSLRLLPALAEADYPVIVASYRGDGLASETQSGRYTWGVEEWPDVEDAVKWASGQGAQGVAIVGFGMGGAIVAQFLHETELLSLVRGIVLDSPLLSLEATSDANAASDGIPRVLHNPAKGVARLRFNLEWPVLDHVARAAEFDVPMLIMQGEDDDIAPPAIAEAFSARLPEGLLTLHVVEGAGHETVWNTDPVRYHLALLGFLDQLSPG